MFARALHLCFLGVAGITSHMFHLKIPLVGNCVLHEFIFVHRDGPRTAAMARYFQPKGIEGMTSPTDTESSYVSAGQMMSPSPLKLLPSKL